MPVIEVSGLTKSFRSYKKQPGFAGALKGLFRREYETVAAVSDISFKIEPGELAADRARLRHNYLGGAD